MIVDKISFAGGEITPLLRAAYDLEKTQTGLARIVNFVGLAQRGITRRPGTRFAAPLANEAQKGLLIPFKAGNDDQAVLVINAGTMRIARQSVWAGLGLSALAMAAAAFGAIPPVAGALLQEAIDVAVILNALRASGD